MSDENMTEDIESGYTPIFGGNGVIAVIPQQTLRIHFVDGQKEVGFLTIENDQLVFTGNADEAARLFFEHVLKPMVDGYIAGRLAE